MRMILFRKCMMAVLERMSGETPTEIDPQRGQALERMRMFRDGVGEHGKLVMFLL